MSEDNEDVQVRRYLLGQVSEDERQQLEERIMTDTELYNRVLLAEDEMVEEYVQGGLSVSEREGFEAAFLSTVEGRRQVSFEKALSTYVSSARGSQGPAASQPAGEEMAGTTGERARAGKVIRPAWWSRPTVAPYFRMAAAAVIVIGMGFGIWRVFIFQSEVSRGLAALNSAYRLQRPIEPRISGLDFAPSSVTRNGAQKVDTVSLNRAQRILLDEAAEHPSAASHHALGRLYLAEQKFDDAVREFEESLQAEPDNAQLHSDYGALLLEIGKAERSKDESGKSLETFARSLEHLTKAIDLDERVLEALYNRALLYEEMMLPRQAEDDWRRYLEKDPNSKWSDEATLHLKAIEAQTSRKSQHRESLFDEFLNAYRARDDDRAWEVFSRGHVRAGNSITERLIDKYLELLTKNEDSQANDLLKALSYAGELQYRRVADRFTFDLARFYEASTSRNTSSLIAARTMVRKAQDQIAQSDLPEALETYARAKHIFDQLGDRAEARVAEYWIVTCASQINPQQGTARFSRLLQACEEQAYKSLAIRALTGLANSHLSLSSYSKAISFARPSLSLARQTQDSYGSVLALSQLIGDYKLLGNFDECLNYLQAFLDLCTTHDLEPVQACLCYAQAAWVLSARDLTAASLQYQKAALKIALELEELTMICTSYVHLAMIEAKLKDYSGALTNASRALEIATQRSTEPAGLKMKAYAQLHLGSIYRQSGELEAAIASYSRSIELYEQIDFPLFTYLAQKGLFASLAASGDNVLARKELKTTISYYENQRTEILEQSNRDSFFDLEQDVYDLAIEFEGVTLGNAQAAFEYSELSRGRSLLGAMYQGGHGATVVDGAEAPPSIPSGSLNLAAIQGSLPDGLQILQYAVLEDRLISWVITRSSFEQVRNDTTSRELTKLVQKCLQLTQDPNSGQDLSCINRQLYDVLIGPVEPLLDKNKQLFIVPDKILSFLPFQSLISPSNKYIIADYGLGLSPSSSVLIACSALAREKRQIGDERVLSVGIAHFSSREGERPADLRSAPREATAIASLYKHSAPLIEGLASKSAVMSGLSKANVVHFASHFIRDPISPRRSRLLLAKEGQSSQTESLVNAELTSSEISGLRLKKVKLAVLSACQTGVERYYRGEGASSIARAFITAGVPLVVASLWPVDSETTAELMTRFHRFRKRDGLASIEALRQAQRSMLDEPHSSQTHPYYWAAFNLNGGYAEY